MKLFTKCNRCEAEVSFFSWETDRVELSMKKGDFLSLQCKKCNHIDKYHLNKVYAKKDRISLIIGLFLVLVGSISTFIMISKYIFQTTYGYSIMALSQIIGLPMIVYIISNKDQQNKISRFNRIRIKTNNE